MILYAQETFAASAKHALLAVAVTSLDIQTTFAVTVISLTQSSTPKANFQRMRLSRVNGTLALS